jgi:hypothetical protein
MEATEDGKSEVLVDGELRKVNPYIPDSVERMCAQKRYLLYLPNFV